MIERIRTLIKSKNLNAAQFADSIGVQRSSISHVLSGRNKPSLEFIQKIMKTYPDINSEWLISGSGEIEKETDSSSDISLFGQTPKTITEETTIGKMKPQPVKKETVELLDKKETLSLDSKSIERVVIFYKDGKFKEYTPE